MAPEYFTNGGYLPSVAKLNKTLVDNLLTCILIFYAYTWETRAPWCSLYVQIQLNRHLAHWYKGPMAVDIFKINAFLKN